MLQNGCQKYFPEVQPFRLLTYAYGGMSGSVSEVADVIDIILAFVM